jgi:hypothetical protein
MTGQLTKFGIPDRKTLKVLPAVFKGNDYFLWTNAKNYDALKLQLLRLEIKMPCEKMAINRAFLGKF